MKEKVADTIPLLKTKETKSNEKRHLKKRLTRVKFLLLSRLAVFGDSRYSGDAGMALILLFFC